RAAAARVRLVGGLRLARGDVVERRVDRARPGHDLGERHGDGVDRVPVDRQPAGGGLRAGSARRGSAARTWTSSGRIAASAERPRVGSAVHSIVTAPLVKPAPKATIVTLSPTF